MPALTPEQSAILDFTSTSTDNLMIRAYAGCGKTFMLETIDQAKKSLSPSLLVCFNKSVATEAATRVRPSTIVKTLNSLGHGIWTDAIQSRPKLSKTKIVDIFRAIVDDSSSATRSEIWREYDIVKSGVEMARAIGYVPSIHPMSHKSLATISDLERHLDETPSDLALYLIDRILLTSIKQSYNGLIDFSDQCYMPAIFGGTFPRIPTILVDEFQDLNPVQQAIINKISKNSRLIGVGDEAQAIYAFRGADEESMPNAIAKFSMHVLPLSTSFRCPSTIVENVRWRVPNFKASRDGGYVETISGSFEIVDGSAVISRNNSPLIRLAMRLVMLGRSVDIGGVEIGQRLIRLLSKLGPETMTKAQTIRAIDSWLAERESLDSKSAADTAACLRVFANAGSNLGQSIAYAKHILSSTGTIRFMTGHKAKGLEFPHVYHLDQHLLKHSRAQDSNIHYVIDSRPSQTLTYINSETV
jgi:DNA helicase-2/ATP-dependent DNA helicase PcrA